METKKPGIWAKAIPAVAFGVLAAGIGWFGHEALGMKTKQAETRTASVPAVAVAPAQAVAFNPPREYVGHVRPIQEVDILPHIEGYVKKVCFAEGDRVAAGDVLFEIDSEQYEAALTLQRANVKSAEAKVLVAEAEVDRAKRYFDRLTEADDRGVTATERDTAETTLASAQAALNAAKASVTEAKASTAIAEFNMKHTLVHAPISGRIGKAFHHVGDLVSPNKSPLAHVVQFDPIRVAFPIPDRDAVAWHRAVERTASARSPWRLRLVLPDGSTYDRDGALDFGENEMDRQTATVVMHARFANPSDRLMPNQFVKVRVDEREPKRVTAVPTLGVVRGADGWHVWVVDDASKAHRRTVETGAVWQGLTVVTKGLEPGERVVVQGTHKLQDGDTVSVVPATEAK